VDAGNHEKKFKISKTSANDHPLCVFFLPRSFHVPPKHIQFRRKPTHVVTNKQQNKSKKIHQPSFHTKKKINIQELFI
jgi:hypothetical protein